jgi:hypothetical protein
LTTIVVDLSAQSGLNTEVVVSLSKTTIKIGEPVQLRVSVRYREGASKVNIVWPVIGDSLSDQIEIQSRDSVQTILRNRASVLYEQFQQFTITSFEPGIHSIPAFTFDIDNETIKNKPIHLNVELVDVDTTKPIQDINAIFEVPPAPPRPEIKKSSSWFWVIAVSIGVIIVGLLLGFFIRRKSSQAMLQSQQSNQLLSPYEQAIKDLEELERKQLWEQPDELKNYHTQLTEILREWTAKRFHIPALELTTAEIVKFLRYKQVDDTPITLLRDILNTADTVKFARNIPPTKENIQSLHTARKFISNTNFRPEPPETEKKTT